MKISLKELNIGYDSLSRIGAIQLNSILKFRYGRVVKQVNVALADLEEARQDLCRNDGGVLRKDGRGFDFPSKEAGDRVNTEFRELLKEEVDIRFDRFSIKTFEDLPIDSNAIADVMWLFGGLEIVEEELAKLDVASKSEAG